MYNRRTDARPFALVLAALVISRLLCFFIATPLEGLGPYTEWAREYQIVQRDGHNFYDYHERRIMAKGQANLLDEARYVEYPPLAMMVIVLPAVGLPVAEGEGSMPADVAARYALFYHLEMLVFDLLAFGLVAWLVRRLYPEESPWEQAERLLVYLGATALLGHLLYNRLDMVLTALLVLALVLLLRPVHYFWSYLVLSAAIAFKLVPLVLVPVWVLGALPACWPAGGGLRALIPLVGRSGLLLTLTAAWFAPFWALGGPRIFDFLMFHKDRGLEIESTYSSALMALEPFWLDLAVDERYGGYNLLTVWSQPIARISGLLTAALLAGASLMLLRTLWRRSDAEEPPTPGGTLAQVRPHLFVYYSLVLLLLAVVSSKVFSPQYLLWVLPLAVLGPWRPWSRRVVMWGLVVICALTTLIFPVLFWKHVTGMIVPRTEPPQFHGPDALGISVLVLRNVLLVGLTVLVIVFGARLRARSASK